MTFRRVIPTLLCCLLALHAALAAAASPSLALKHCKQALYRGDYAQAETLATEELKVHPHASAVRVILGRAQLAQGKFQVALEQFRKVLASEPRNIDALYYLSFTARALSQQEYQRLFALDPNSSRVHQLLGQAALEAEDPAQAEAEFQQALKINPGSAEVAIELAELKRSQSKFDDAISYYNQAEQIGGVNYDVAYGLGACYIYNQEYGKAQEWLKKAVTLGPVSGAAHFALGDAFFMDGKLDAAIPELKASLRFEPRMRQAYFLLGRAYSKLGRKEEANAAFQKLEELDRTAVPASKSGLPQNSSPELPQ